MSKVLMRRLPVPTGELIRENFRPDTVDSDGENMVGDGRVSCFDAPEWLTETQISSEQSIRHILSHLSAPTVADGLKMISAPLRAYIIQFCG